MGRRRLAWVAILGWRMGCRVLAQRVVNQSKV